MGDSIFGYFDSPDAPPAYDPGLDALCPICLSRLRGEALKTISLMAVGDARSYFFRAHKTCWDNASPADQQQIESSLIDSIVPGKA